MWALETRIASNNFRSKSISNTLTSCMNPSFQGPCSCGGTTPVRKLNNSVGIDYMWNNIFLYYATFGIALQYNSAWVPRTYYLHDLSFKLRRVSLMRGGKYCKVEYQSSWGDRYLNWFEIQYLSLLTEVSPCWFRISRTLTSLRLLISWKKKGNWNTKWALNSNISKTEDAQSRTTFSIAWRRE